MQLIVWVGIGLQVYGFMTITRRFVLVLDMGQNTWNPPANGVHTEQLGVVCAVVSTPCPLPIIVLGPICSAITNELLVIFPRSDPDITVP